MTPPLVEVQYTNDVATVVLNDPDRRNALSIAMFDALCKEWEAMEDHGAVVIAGKGPSFCAGFDLPAAIDDPSVMPLFINRLSELLRMIRRHRRPVVAAARGAAIAGGCAILSACDFVVASTESKMGYPVHPIGVSPAVSLPTLRCGTGDGSAREILMSGKVYSGSQLHRLGLVTHLVEDGEIETAAAVLAAELAKKPRGAMAVTKALLNDLDGSNQDDAFEATMTATADVAAREAAGAALRSVWSSRR